MKAKVLKVHPSDDMIVALTNLDKGTEIEYNGEVFTLVDDIQQKHKFATKDFNIGDEAHMYGVLVGKATKFIPKGGAISTANLSHATHDYGVRERKISWDKPDTSRFEGRTFMGYHRADGQVGTANYWVVMPLVFCENRNLAVMKEALNKTLGYEKPSVYTRFVEQLLKIYDENGNNLPDEITVKIEDLGYESKKVFPNVDGIKYLAHAAGCGGTQQDARALAGLLAGYATHANTAGVTVLSLGCQHLQTKMMLEEIEKRTPNFSKPFEVFTQQEFNTERALIQAAIESTFRGLVEANKLKREPAPLSALSIGLECGGSDGFSGISANPAVGHCADLISALGGTAVLSEFPELAGVEQELVDRCFEPSKAERFLNIMRAYEASAKFVGSGFDANPSPGNIRDGLITDAIKSAGAAKKGGTSPIMDVLDYPEKISKPGLNLLCTPGNDVESCTALAAAGCQIILFTTGLGTPTGNPVAQTIKVSSNTALFNRMHDIIDIDAGTIITGDESIAQVGERMLEMVIATASGEYIPKAVLLNQDDFIPWKRGVSL